VRRSATLLPSALTLGNLFAGFFAIMAAMDGRHTAAAVALVVAAALDMLDGRLARLTRSVSEFGMELDSLADAVSFGVAPAVLVQQWALLPLRRVGWGAAFLLAACGVIRLARYNARQSVADNRYFSGLPIPVTACLIAGLVLVVEQTGGGPPPPWPVAGLVVLLALLMVSPVRYRSFKTVDPWGHPYLATAVLAVFIAAAAVWPEPILVILATGYLLMGPVEGLLRRRRLARRARSARESETDAGEPAEAHTASR
jgi:CDP-diacylglycerol--serine O-phosphatidyltransferase